MNNKEYFGITDELKSDNGIYEDSYRPIYIDLYVNNDLNAIKELEKIGGTTYRLYHAARRGARFLAMESKEIYYTNWDENTLINNNFKKVTFTKHNIRSTDKLKLICELIDFDTSNINFPPYGIHSYNDFFIDENNQVIRKEISPLEIIFTIEFRDKLREYYLENICHGESVYEKDCIYKLMMNLDNLEEYLYDLLNITPKIK